MMQQAYAAGMQVPGQMGMPLIPGMTSQQQQQPNGSNKWEVSGNN